MAKTSFCNNTLKLWFIITKKRIDKHASREPSIAFPTSDLEGCLGNRNKSMVNTRKGRGVVDTNVGARQRTFKNGKGLLCGV